MAKILCDTNVFIYAFNGNEEVIAQINKIGKENIVISAVTVMELLQGMGNKSEMNTMKKRIKYFDVFEITPVISRLARKYIEKYKLSHGLAIPDAIIAATAVITQSELYTYNLKDFSFIPSIKIYQLVE